VLRTRFLEPRGISEAALARHIGVKRTNLCAQIHRRRRITPVHAWLLGAALGTTPQYWNDLQADWDLWHARPRRELRPFTGSTKVEGQPPGDDRDGSDRASNLDSQRRQGPRTAPSRRQRSRPTRPPRRGQAEEQAD
jgi:addiction module HigA family antidote